MVTGTIYEGTQPQCAWQVQVPSYSRR